MPVRSFYRIVPFGFFVSVALLVISGCDNHPKRVPVAGHVLIDGQPLKHGTVTFVPDNDRQSSGALDENGHFALSCYRDYDGAVLGHHRVQIDAKEPLDQLNTRWHAPKKYASYVTSDLSQDITGPADDLEIKLTWDGGKPFVQSNSAPPSKDKKPRRGE